MANKGFYTKKGFVFIDRVLVFTFLVFSSLVFMPQVKAVAIDGFFLTKSVSGLPLLEPESTFDCFGDIYFVALGGIENEKLYDRLSLVWTYPDGTNRMIERKVSSQVWVDSIARWGGLRLPEKKGIGVFSFFQRDLGYQKFNGEWNVSLFHKGKKMSQKKFFVMC